MQLFVTRSLHRPPSWQQKCLISAMSKGYITLSNWSFERKTYTWRWRKRSYSWNLADFTKSSGFHMKSGGFHEIQQISHEIQQISWNPLADLINQIIQEKLFSFVQCRGKAMSQDFMKICQIFMWNPPDFERPTIARNGKACVFFNVARCISCFIV